MNYTADGPVIQPGLHLGTPGLPRVVDSDRKAPWMVGNLTREERVGPQDDRLHKRQASEEKTSVALPLSLDVPNVWLERQHAKP